MIRNRNVVSQFEGVMLFQQPEKRNGNCLAALI
jgi:hypothetical protein